jgi:hypothetical protein
MELKEIQARGATVLLTPDEVLTISNALNEVCNGLDLPEFATRMGVEREDALSLLKDVSALYDKLAAPHDATRLKWPNEFCGQALGIGNFGVPKGELLFVAPEMVVHYVERHAYCPPTEFIQAVLQSPLPDTEEYRLITERFWHMHWEVAERQARTFWVPENKGPVYLLLPRESLVTCPSPNERRLFKIDDWLGRWPHGTKRATAAPVGFNVSG